MPDFWFRLLLAHMIGDYILQTDWQAKNKTALGRTGLWASLAHALSYTAVVSLLLWQWDWRVPVLVFLTHWPLDRYSLMKRLKLPLLTKGSAMEAGPGREIALSLAIWLVIIPDNVAHLALMWGGLKLLGY